MFNEFWLRLKALVSRRRFDRDLEDEIAFHLAMREEKNRAGSNGDDARNAARREFGNSALVKEDCREMRSFTLLETLGQDIRYGCRLLRKSVVFTLVAVFTLALGIGANTAIFSLTYQILLRRLPVSHPEDLVVLRSPGPKEGSTNSDGDSAASFSYPLYKDLRERDKVFAGLLARLAVPLSVSAMGRAERAAGELVSGNYFDVLGVTPALGRVFGMDDETTGGANPVAVLSYSYWTRRFGNDPSVLNKQITVNGTLLTVVGVTRPGFGGIQVGQMPDVFIPITMKAQMTPSWNGLDDRRSHWVAVLGRMKPGMTVESSQAAVQAIFHPLLEAEVPLEKIQPRLQERFLARKLLLLPGSHGRPILQSDTKAPLTFLMAMVSLVLLIACANLAGLLIARGEARHREIAVRLSIGASRRRVLRQLLTEGLLLALAGGAAGLALAPLLLRVILRTIGETTGVAGFTAQLNSQMLFFALALALVTTVLFALLPALRLVRALPLTFLKEQSGGSESSAGLRKWLIIGQVVLTTVLLTGAGLFTQSLINIRNVDLGLETGHAMQFSISPALSRYTAQQTIDLISRLRTALAAQPGVRSVSAAEVPIMADSTTSAGMTAEGYNVGESEETNVEQNWIAPGYFSTMRIPLLAGREFADSDNLDSPKVAIVNQALVHRYFAGRDAIGKRIVFGRGNVHPDTEIVGVVANSKHENPREPVVPFAYMPIAQDKRPAGITFYVRTAQDPSAAAGMLRSAVAGLDSALPIYDLKTLDAQVNDSMVGDRVMAYLCIWLGLLAASLAAMGLYGVMAYIVLRRTREIGIRMALGATRESVARMVLGEVMRMTLIGLSIGLVAAVVTGHFIESQLFGVKGWNPLVLLLAALLLMVVGLAAGSLPARRAARVQPVIALRYE
jgi:putative ABC transport system permease protein